MKVSIKTSDHSTNYRTAFLFLCTAGLVIYVLLPAPAFSQHLQHDPYPDKQWGVILHSHGTTGSGWDAVVNLQRAAGRNNISAVILTEQLIAQWSWGPPVIRGVWGYRRTIPSIRSYGIERFFNEAEEADRQVPDVTLIAGAEVAAYYYWTGVPWKRNLTMWNWQRNLLVLDLPEPALFGLLPVLGLRHSLLQTWRDYIWLGTLIIFIALFLTALNYLYFVRAAVALIPVALLLWSGPPPPGPFSPYIQNAGIKPYQTLIDSVDSWGGLALWSLVETVDDHHYSWGRIHTDPHPEVLTQTHSYHGFGVMYPDNLTAQEPGHEWDTALSAYLNGTSINPPWGWGELALHQEQLGEKKLWHNMTVLFAPDPSREELLHALREGRGYAVHSDFEGGRLRLNRFDAISHEGVAGMGQWLSTTERPSVNALIGFTGEDPPPVTIRLISGGEVVATTQGTPPLALEWTPPSLQPGTRTYCRLLVEGRGHKLFSNPIFIEYPPQVSPGYIK